MEVKYHIPVMLNEAVDCLNLGPGKVVIDATCGTGGHAQGILERIIPGGRLIAIDRDRESLDISRQRLSGYKENCEFVHANFSDIDNAIQKFNIAKVDAVLFDLGISSFQLQNPERGFSFQSQGPLDMRMDRDNYISAYDLLNNLNEEEISVMLRNFGQERWHNRIARYLVTERQRHPISTTTQLADIVVRSIPARFRHRHCRIHPATRTFQAVRIAVNREIETLELALGKAIELLKRKGRICVISFHSLEDRAVKHGFRRASQEGRIEILTVKPMSPSCDEIGLNPSARSSKLRAAERL